MNMIPTRKGTFNSMESLSTKQGNMIRAGKTNREALSLESGRSLKTKAIRGFRRSTLLRYNKRSNRCFTVGLLVVCILGLLLFSLVAEFLRQGTLQITTNRVQQATLKEEHQEDTRINPFMPLPNPTTPGYPQEAESVADVVFQENKRQKNIDAIKQNVNVMQPETFISEGGNQDTNNQEPVSTKFENNLKEARTIPANKVLKTVGGFSTTDFPQGRKIAQKITTAKMRLVHQDEGDIRGQPSAINTVVMKTAYQSKDRIILLYTTLFGQSRWTDLNDEQIKDYPIRAKCPHANTCKLTYDKAAIDYAHAVIFHGVDLQNEKKYGISLLRDAIQRRPLYQRWVFFMHESPANYPNFGSYRNLFNWTMTYERRSDIFIPYNHFHPSSPEEAKQVQHKDYSAGKKKLAIWLVSNCVQIRADIIRVLQQWLDISIYGRCAEQMGSKLGTCKGLSNECLTIIKEHKFYFAFENSLCRDYVTEKFWLSLTHYELVPVVWGANYNNDIVMPGSYIDIAKFSSLKLLADYLHYLDKNDTAYNEYFQWKKKYSIRNFDKICRLCDLLHENNLQPKIYNDIWSIERSCKEYEPQKEQMQKMINEAKQFKQ